MSDSFARANGRKVVSRASAQELGGVSRLFVDVKRGQIAAIVIGKGKRAQLVDWPHLTGFGPDAVMVADEHALRPAADEHEQAAADGKLDLIGKRAISERGNELGQIDDVTFDPDTGVLEDLVIGDLRVPASSLLGNGSYAAVLDANQDPGGGR